MHDIKYTYVSIKVLTARHWWLTPVILLRRQRSGESWFEASPGQKKVRPYLKNAQPNSAGRLAQVAEHLPSKKGQVQTPPKKKKSYYPLKLICLHYLISQSINNPGPGPSLF
jgi:hypothetical protein